MFTDKDDLHDVYKNNIMVLLTLIATIINTEIKEQENIFVSQLSIDATLRFFNSFIHWKKYDVSKNVDFTKRHSKK